MGKEPDESVRQLTNATIDPLNYCLGAMEGVVGTYLRQNVNCRVEGFFEDF